MLSVSSIDAKDQITVVGFAESNEGHGQVVIFDSQSLEQRQVIPGSEARTKVGGHVKIQRDPLSSGDRIWYSAKNEIVMASYVQYGQSLVL